MSGRLRRKAAKCSAPSARRYTMKSFQRPPMAASAAVSAQPGIALAREAGERLPAGAFLAASMGVDRVDFTGPPQCSHMLLLPIRLILSCVVGLSAVAASAGAVPDSALAIPSTPAGAPRDFDFEHGSWKTTLRRRLHPLSGSDAWVDYAGTTIVHPLSGGKANVVELDVSGSAGRIQALSLRLFDTQQAKWTLNFSSMASG